MTEDRSGYFTPTPADRIQVVDLDETKLLVHVGLDKGHDLQPAPEFDAGCAAAYRKHSGTGAFEVNQNRPVAPAMERIYFLVQHTRELEAAIRYLQFLQGPPQRYMLGVPTAGKHVAERKQIEPDAFFKTLRGLHPSAAQLRDIEAVEKQMGATA
jgi:hypothetical protein